jgi:hypothetical protein
VFDVVTFYSAMYGFQFILQTSPATHTHTHTLTHTHTYTHAHTPSLQLAWGWSLCYPPSPTWFLIHYQGLAQFLQKKHTSFSHNRSPRNVHRWVKTILVSMKKLSSYAIALLQIKLLVVKSWFTSKQCELCIKRFFCHSSESERGLNLNAKL